VTLYLRIFLVGFFALALSAPAQAAAGYAYAHNEAEYSVVLPEAPTVKTLWGDSDEKINYVDKLPKDGPLGEIANFRRVDMETEDTFDAKISFIKVPRNLLLAVDEEKMKTVLQGQYKTSPLLNAQFSFSGDGGPLKWASITGFSVDRNGHPAFNAMHYLTGQQSILVIQVAYSVENKTFQDYYQTMLDSINYLAP
jgi:hypothetical protein